MCLGKSLKRRKPEWELYRCRIWQIPPIFIRAASFQFYDLDLITTGCVIFAVSSDLFSEVNSAKYSSSIPVNEDVATTYFL